MTISAEQPDTIASLLKTQFLGNSIIIAAPLAMYKKGEFTHELEKLFTAGYYRFIIDGQRHTFKKIEDILLLKLRKTERHTIDVLLDSCEVTESEAARLTGCYSACFCLSKWCM